MNPTLACALLAAALGLALGFAPRSVLPRALGLYAVIAVALSFARPDYGWREGLFVACWVSVVLTSATVYLPARLLRPWAFLALAAHAGLWTGLLVALGDSRFELLKSLPLALLCLPACWLVSTGKGIAVKVVASWLIAIAVLAVALSTVPTPGYAKDHMD